MTAGKEQLTLKDDEDDDDDFDGLLKAKTVTSKGKAIKVEQKHFQAVNEKIAKQNAADAFRRKFATRKTEGARAETKDGIDNDIDEFLGELKLKDKGSEFIILTA